jgi:hypothetical protein
MGLILAVGCNGTSDSGSPVGGFLFGGEAGTRRVLPATNYDEAFAAARTVMGHYFEIASADRSAGVIETEPKAMDEEGVGLLNRAAQRQLGKLQLRQGNEGLIAIVSVLQQRQGSAVYRQMQTEQDNYDSVPNTSPAESDAATTATQNETWETYQVDRSLETQILNDLQNALTSATPDAQ